MLQKWFAIELWKRIMVALVLGVIVGQIWGEGAVAIKPVGDIFIRLIRMLIIPLIFTTLVSGVVAMGDPKKLGSIGLKTIALYLATTAVAIVIGLTLAALLQPGAGVDLAGAAPQTLEATKSVAERLYGIIPTNPIGALASGNVLAVIFFSVLLGIGILLAGDKAAPVAKLFDAGAAVMLKITHMVMEVAPFGVFALIAWIIGIGGMKTLIAVAALGIAVYGGCLLQIFVVYGSIIRFALKLPAGRFFQGILDAQMVAYSTDSSAATLPVTMSVAEQNLGIKKTISSSVLPLGATINMDGTALYVGIVALFAAQAFGIQLDFADYLIIGLTTTLVSIGAAGVPSASLFLLAAVLESIGMTADQTAIVVGFLLPFDRILDMMRTATNVSGDLCVATVVARTEGEFDEASFRAAPVE